MDPWSNRSDLFLTWSRFPRGSLSDSEGWTADFGCQRPTGDDELRMAALTRDDVAKRLGASISTVRRLGGTRLHPLIDDKSVPFRGIRCRATREGAGSGAALAAQRAAGRGASGVVFERLEQPPEDGAWACGRATRASTSQCRHRRRARRGQVHRLRPRDHLDVRGPHGDWHDPEHATLHGARAAAAE